MRLLLVLFLVTWTVKGDAPGGCGPGGYRLRNGTCICHRYWSSTSGSCDQIQCLNGGYSKDGATYCICASGYLGPHCESVLTSAPPTSAFAKTSTFNLVIYNAFTDYWGKSGYDLFRNSVAQHLEGFSYSQYNMAVYKGSNAMEKEYRSVVSESKKDDFLTLLQNETLSYPDSYSCMNLAFYKPMYNYITKLGLRDTAITVVTQFPAADDDESYDALLELAIAFSIRINVVWISDETFVRCFFLRSTNPQYDNMKQLSSATGGYFVPQKYGPVDSPTDAFVTFTDVVIASHYQYQPIAIGAATDCSSGLSLSWLGNDMNTYVIVEGDANSTFTGCSAAEIRGSLNSGQTIFQLKNATSNCSLRLTNNGQQCSAKVFGIDGSNVGIRVYSTLVEDVIIDSSRTQPSTEYSLHLALHVERNKIVTSGNITIDSCTIRSDKGDTRLLKMTNRATPSAFNFVSSDTFTCDPTATGLYWAEVHFTVTTTIIVTTTSQTLQRYVQFTCRNGTFTTTTTSSTPTSVGSSPTSTTLSTTLSIDTQSTHSSTVVQPTTTSPAPTPTNFPINNPITLAYGFANTLPRTIYETFAVTAMNNINNTFGYFGVVRFEVQNESTVIYHPQKDIGSMQNAVYNLYRYGGIAGTPQSSDSQFLVALATATDSPYLYENSLLMFCMDKLPRSPDYIKFTKLTSKNVKTLFLMDVSAINRELGYKRTAEPLNEIAAATNGHLIVSDQSDTQNFANLVQFLCTSGPSQSLLFARSFPYANPSANLGTLNVKQNVQVVITATSSIYGVGELGDAGVRIAFSSSGSPISVPLTFMSNSNFYKATIDLPADLYNITVTISSYKDGSDFHLRMWIPRTNQRLKVKYVDLDMKDLDVGPDTVNGAAARVTLFGGAQPNTLSMEIRDCAGHSVALYDTSQQQQLASSGDAFFVPFFCKNNSSTALCAAGTQDKYHVQYTSTNGFSEMRSFACSNSDTNSAANCLKENSYSDIECTGAQKPFFRGPTGKVLDCSNNGQLQYLSATKNYVCNCNAGFTGVSCEIGICEKPTSVMEEVDVQFRTYTIVIGVDATSYGLESVLLRSVANLTSLTSQPKTIWRYQLILYCDNKQVMPVYIGGSFDDFNAMMTSSLRDTYCSNPAYTKFDLTQVYQSAVSSLGRFVRGIFVFYTEKQTSMELDLDTFMSVSRNYRQELHVIVTIPKAAEPLDYDALETVRSASFATGGNVLYVDSDQHANLPPTNAFSEMLSSKTSLALLEKNLIGSGSAFIEAGASGYVFLSSRDINAVRVVTGAGTVLSPAQIFGRYSAVFQLNGDSSYAVQGVTSDDFTASVVVLNGITPSSIIVDSMQDDSTTAFASPDSDVGPSLALALPSGWQATNSTNVYYRVTPRSSCSFNSNAFTVFPTMGSGANYLTVVLSNGTTTVQRVLPFAVTSSMACQNGGSSGLTRCSCPPDYTSVDCSRPLCDQGQLNSWGDACNCDWSSNGGLHCKRKSTTI